MKNQKDNTSLPRLNGLYYDNKTIFEYRDLNKLLCVRLDLSYACNLKCKYCYNDGVALKEKEEASYQKHLDYVLQCIDLGIKSIVILGGEPLMYPYIFDFLTWLYNKNIIPVLFTNGLLLNKETIRKLYELNVSLLIKFDAFNHIQDFLCGNGFSEKRGENLVSLFDIGYNKFSADSLRLGIASVVTKVNYNEIEYIWRYARSNNIFPHVERMTVKSEATEYLAITEDQNFQMNQKLKNIDADEYDNIWDAPYYAIPGYNCSIFYVGCHINPYHEVSLCPELPPVASLKDHNLRTILKDEIFQKARNIDKTILGKCSNCIYLKSIPCYGCRSKTFYKMKNIFEEDCDCPI